MNILAFRIKIVDHNICIAGVTSCKDNNFKFFWQIFKDICGVGTNIDPSFDNFSSWKNNR